MVKLKINQLKELLQEPYLLFADVPVVPKEEAQQDILISTSLEWFFKNDENTKKAIKNHLKVGILNNNC